LDFASLNDLLFNLHLKQGEALRSGASEILFGGAAGGGKSHLLRVAAITWCAAIPGLQVYLFRRTMPELMKNHLEGPSGLPALLGAWTTAKICKVTYSGSPGVNFLCNGSKIHLCHSQYENDVFKFQGAEMHVLMIDELTQWSEQMYLFLRSRVRMSGLYFDQAKYGNFPKIICSANPGGIGHNWVKSTFIDPSPEGIITERLPEDGGMRRQFISSRLEDNPSLAEDDPGYLDRLSGLGSPTLVKAMREGDWNIVAGGMFDDVWDPDLQIVQCFKIPPSWRIDRSFDWGSSRPFSIGWWAESDGSDFVAADGKRLSTVRGDLFRIAEWYGSNGKANVGTRQTPTEIANGIKVREQMFIGKVQPGPADSSIWDNSTGHSIADEMRKQGVRWTKADKSPGSRKLGWSRLRTLLSNASSKEHPGIYVFDGCRDFIRTIPTLPRSSRDPDDVDTLAEDHIADETRYRVYSRVRISKLGQTVGLY